MSEVLELGDDPSGVAFGVTADEVVAAEVAVGTRGAETCTSRRSVCDADQRAAVAGTGLESVGVGRRVAARVRITARASSSSDAKPSRALRCGRSAACRPIGRCPGSGRSSPTRAGAVALANTMTGFADRAAEVPPRVA